MDSFSQHGGKDNPRFFLCDYHLSISDTGHITMRNSEKCFYDWNDFWNVAPKNIQEQNRSIVPSLTLENLPDFSYGAGPARIQSALPISGRQARCVMSTSAVYRDVNVERRATYWDYDNFSIKFSQPSRYKIVQRIGGGKFSKTFLAIDRKLIN